MQKMLTKIRPAPSGLPTLCSALIAKARPRSVVSRPQSLGRASQVAMAQTAKPTAERKKNELKRRRGPQTWPRLAEIQLNIRVWRSESGGKASLE
jgi:hypothetical protein